LKASITFIGGASVKLSGNINAFTGLLKHHPDEQRILYYLKTCGVEAAVPDRQSPSIDVRLNIPLIEEVL
jgi:hypothetical protein